MALRSVRMKWSFIRVKATCQQKSAGRSKFAKDSLISCTLTTRDASIRTQVLCYQTSDLLPHDTPTNVTMLINKQRSTYFTISDRFRVQTALNKYQKKELQHLPTTEGNEHHNRVGSCVHTVFIFNDNTHRERLLRVLRSTNFVHALSLYLSLFSVPVYVCVVQHSPSPRAILYTGDTHTRVVGLRCVSTVERDGAGT